MKKQALASALLCISLNSTQNIQADSILKMDIVKTPSVTQELIHEQLKSQTIKLFNFTVKEELSSVLPYLTSTKMLKYFDIEARKRVQEIADSLNIQPIDLYRVFKTESGGNPQAVNKITTATGLIQFMPKTAIRLGTSVEDLYNMSTLEQLDYVEKYLMRIHKRYTITNYHELYLSIFYPAALAKQKTYVFGLEHGIEYAQKVARQNKIFDTNNDGFITKADFHSYTKQI